MKLIRAAGGLVWRDTPAGLRLAVVHRARRGDWSLPKGKLDRGESWEEAASREIEEETGCGVRLGSFAGAKLYVDRPQPKLVLYWHARVVREGTLDSADEIDEVAWLSRREALNRLDHASDRRLVLRTLGSDRDQTWRVAPSAPRHFGLEELRNVLIVDSPRVEEAFPSLIDVVAQVVASRVGVRVGRLAR